MPLTALEAADVRRFAGYPVAAAAALQDAATRGASMMVDAVLALLTDGDVAVVQMQLASLRLLEADIPAMRDSLDTKQAAVWHRNPAEMAEREALFMVTRRRLCAFLGVEPGPGLFLTTAGTAPGAGPGATLAPAVFLV